MTLLVMMMEFVIVSMDILDLNAIIVNIIVMIKAQQVLFVTKKLENVPVNLNLTVISAISVLLDILDHSQIAKVIFFKCNVIIF